MIVAGKCPPEEEELEKAFERGFENVELYLERRHLDSFEEALEACLEAEVDVVSVHTPHVSLGESGYFVKADELASRLDAYLVFHSACVHFSQLSELEEFDSNHGFENQPGTSMHHWRNALLEEGRELVFDVAHFYMASNSFQEGLETVLDRFSDSMSVVHLCDSTELDDGLAFGEGEISVEETIRKVKASEFDGVVVLEVMPGDQEEALEKWREVG
ncbi:MAG: sugar phosphate isomerase/epimerase family protein [Candidatus Nanohalobium sp.]